ncbi:universal stress protein UspE [Alteromonas pelagimontana]|uniref:Universal stress protein UspE n=1 Tax=Alteromonas pelagimontana TaxID=1858656 RepID=A0A6M4MAW6_9ALTE|nr:universal stress protein UspE [Alteromonas pelagimontana]QJR79306.1 universal stress protein UspE [Alteromonas pelagimontana]QJR82664.1 universal stress protein UspE [Alteromonas pelagimontana]
MINYNQLLVVIDPERDRQPALSRALEVADKTGAAITAILVVYDFSYDMTTMLSGEEREAMRDAVVKDKAEWLKNILANHTSQPIDVVVEWHNRAHEAITHYVTDNHVDMVIKATKRHDDFASILFTPTDWHLLRRCPCPVLLVKDHAWPAQGNILAALNVGTEDREHAQLNEKLTSIAQDYANLLIANVHLVNSYPGTPLNVSIEVPEFDSATYNNSVRNHHIEEMEAHAKKFKIDFKNCHVIEGMPEKVVPQVAKKIDCELVIIGTVGRVGISAALIGNTAEHVIDELECDVLAVKPDGFSSRR